MKLQDLPPDFTPNQFIQLDKESLDMVPYDTKKWCCQCKGCTNGTRVRDYGIAPFFFLDRNSKRAAAKTADYWCDLRRNYWLCNKHLKFFKRLSKIYGEKKTADKMLEIVAPVNKVVPMEWFKVMQQVEEKIPHFTIGS